jgi:GT2 family glycosyltransferase
MILSALMTCHNRRASTVSCIAAFFSQELPPGWAPRVTLVDDASTDGTAEEVRARFPEVRIVGADGTLFWCRGMQRAWKHAAGENPDAYLWLNDDTLLLPGALRRLLEVWSGAKAAGMPATIVVGAVRDPGTGQYVYGGQRRAGRNPARVDPVGPSTRVESCDTFQGNCVLVPRDVFERVGLIDSFQHGMGDTDYGLRAVRAGCRILVAPGYSAECPGNPKRGQWLNRRLGRRERWRLLRDRKELPPGDWLKFMRRHGGFAWPLYFLSPYLRVLLGR